MKNEKKKTKKRFSSYSKRVVTFSLIAASLGYGVQHYYAQTSEKILARKAAERRTTNEDVTTEILETENEKNQSFTENEEEIKAVQEATKQETNDNETNPYIGVNTGFTDSFQEVTADNDGIKIQTKAKSSFSIGAIAQYKSVIFLDREIAAEFFSTPNYEKYISGTVRRDRATSEGLYPSYKDKDISDIWDKRSSEVMYYDENNSSIVYKTPNYGGKLSSVRIEIELELDLGQWTKDTGRFVERKDYYELGVRSSTADWFGIGGSWNPQKTVISSAGILNSWIENPVLTPTIETEDEQLFSGNGKQNHNHDHDTNYSIELLLNDKIYKSNIPMDEEGNWSFKFPLELQKGDEVAARVVGVETSMNNNQTMNKKYSKLTVFTVGESSLQYEDWEVFAPELSPAYDGENLIQGAAPKQNLHHSRSYTLVVSVGGKEYKRVDNIQNNQELLVSHFPELRKGQKIEAYFIGHEEGQKDKVSSTTSITVQANTDEGNYSKWVVEPATISPSKENEKIISGYVPVQNRFNERRYDLQIFLNGELIETRKNISANGYRYSVTLEDFARKDVILHAHDQISTKVIGHEAGEADKASKTTTYEVPDETDYDKWQVKSPTLEEVGHLDTEILGVIPSELQTHNKTYDLIVYVNNQEIQRVTDVKPKDKFKVDIPENVELAIGTIVSAKIVGHQPDRKDKESRLAFTVVVDSTDHKDWIIPAPIVEDIYVGDKTITGIAEDLDVDFDRSYEAEIFVNEELIGKSAVENSSFLYEVPSSTKLQETDRVKVRLVGKQEGFEEKFGNYTEMSILPKVFTTISEFEAGYWENFGLVYEGQINNDGWDLTDKSRITKQATLVDENKQVVAPLTTTTTDWYEPGKYNGYQVIVDNNALTSLAAGSYTIHMSISIDDILVEEQELHIDPSIGRMGPIHTNYSELEQVVINQNIVQPQILDNKPGIVIAKTVPSQSIKLFNKYWNDEAQLVFDGYLTTNQPLENTMKKLMILDTAGNTVYEKEQLTAAPTSWGIQTGIADIQTFQAIIPNEFSNQNVFRYVLIIENEANEEILLEDLF